ncbi:drug resistance protein [Drechmeria coniospora]|uniref:Drug resistance protein n=1 Tax=Drechmeria coniospora TaxID=98403 RepID=A0A151GBP1_DRECN|nr:drug resistance protein [Drechmeria coniospora]KYK54473.1 drug resistance protein [Drechmeria coniospora]ODA77248.1 hypothetical protein RJ55_06875 [Drechmeria coniospora]
MTASVRGADAGSRPDPRSGTGTGTGTGSPADASSGKGEEAKGGDQESAPPPAPSPLDLAHLGRRRPPLFAHWLAEVGFVTTIVLSMMLSEYFISGFSIVLPPLADALDIAIAARTWPAGVTNLTTAALLQPCARLCDLYGSRVVFLAGHAWLLLWSIVAGFSTSPIMLILCRAMQGIGPAAFLPAGLALLSQTYRPGPRKNLVFAIYGAFACLGFYVGIFVGALAVAFLTWRWYFWIGAAVGFAIALAALLTTIPRSERAVDPNVSMDWWGVVTIVPGLILVVFAFTDGGHAPDGWRTPYVYLSLLAGLIFLAAAVYVEGWVAKQPLLSPEIFRQRRGLKRLMGALFCSYGVFGLFLFYASFYIETVMHASAMLTAAWFTPMAVGGMILAITGGFILHLVPNRILMVISCLGFLLSTLLFALMPEEGSTSFLYWAYIFPAMLGGTIGVDITFNVTNVYITTAMPRRHQAAAGGLINSLLYLGIAFWLGIAELAVSAKVEADGRELDPRTQYQIGFWTGVALSVVSLALTVTVKMGQAEAALTADEKAELERQSEDS